ncbi:hypothetical protein DFH07DRAFT_790133 [Mycena maculata]|uniref:Uncharacterized protein n=1 Tax=Mycena maculata TaxID=230809 RepID=A0AAD7KDE8_9AGAR|nr:hypothetical protein DFH07DRAFT_790133 [Mycena maculata]
MSVDSSAQSEATFFSAGSSALAVLSNRIKSRLALRRLHFATKTDENTAYTPEEESEDENASSDSESSSSECTPKPPSVARRTTSNLYYWNRPKVEFLDLPLEIIEHIAVSLRDPKSPLDEAALYISDKYSDFSEARFHLSALSKVSSGVRNAVERILYRNIQLDFTGWKGRKHTGWPAGSLRLLLRTITERPELGRYIYTAALDYQIGSTNCEVLEAGLEQFLARTPNLTHLFLSQCPLAMWGLPSQHLEGFATNFAPGILPSLLEHFSVLKDLHLRDCHVMALSGALPPHELRRVRLDSSHENASGYFARVLTICGNSVHDLDVRFIGGLQLRAPLFLPEAVVSPGGGSAIRNLRLDNLSVLTHLASGYAQLLREIPALEHLHVSHHAPFASGAFGVLPPSLLSLTASAYYGLWTTEPGKEGFMTALAGCISMSTKKEVACVEASSGNEKDERQDLQPVIAACKTERLLFEKIEVPTAFVTVFFGTKVACRDDEDSVASPPQLDTDDEGEASFQDVIAAIPTRHRAVP